MSNFKERRDVILDQFNRAKIELESLNQDIDAKVQENNAKLLAIRDENQELFALKTSNSSSIKAFSKLFG